MFTNKQFLIILATATGATALRGGVSAGGDSLTSDIEHRSIKHHVATSEGSIYGDRSSGIESLKTATIFKAEIETGDSKVLRNLRGLEEVDYCSDPELNFCHTNARCALNASAPRGYDCLCLEADGWTGDGIFICSDFNECEYAYPCAPKDLGGGCVDHNPDHDPPKYSCFCDEFFRPEEVDDVHGPLKCVPHDLCALGIHDCDPDNGICTQEGDTTVCSCAENFSGDGKTCVESDTEATDLGCSRDCQLPKEQCLVDGVDFPKCTCLDGFSRGANGDSCQPIEYCNEANVGTSCPAPGTDCVQLEGGFICLCKAGHVGGAHSVEGCVLTPAPTTANPSFAPSDSLSPTMRETEAVELAPVAPRPAPAPVPCATESTSTGLLQCLVNLLIPGTFGNAVEVDPSLAKFEALEWVLASDALSFGGAKSTAADALLSNDDLIQRFGVVLLLYSLGLESSINADAHECDWSSSPTPQIDCDANQVVVGFETNCTGELVNIPNEISLLRNLEALIIDNDCHDSGGGLVGTIPSSIGTLTQLTDLVIIDHGYDLDDPIPTEFGFLTNLVRLNLEGNDLDGSIPTELGLLTKLTELDVEDNDDLEGPIPTELGLLTMLTQLDLEDNKLTGSIPTELGLLINLVDLDLEDNELTGSIPSELALLTMLEYLDLHGNEHLDSTIPVEIGNLNLLRSLELDDNQLTGSIPSELGLLTMLTRLDLKENLLSSNIPVEIGNLNLLRVLELDDNQLTGFIPSELGLLTMLTLLDLKENLLDGTVPAELGSLVNLETFEVEENSVSGTIPVQFCDSEPVTTTYFDRDEVDCSQMSSFCRCRAHVN